ncbi:hypothetical protein HGM15179_018604, partial [Zosterops borbonicus]
IIERIEHSFRKEVSKKDLFVLLTTLYNFLPHRSHEYYIWHLRSHTTLPGPIVEALELKQITLDGDTKVYQYADDVVIRDANAPEVGQTQAKIIDYLEKIDLQIPPEKGYWQSPTIAHHALALELKQITLDGDTKVYQYADDVVIRDANAPEVGQTQAKIIDYLEKIDLQIPPEKVQLPSSCASLKANQW